MIRFLFKGLLRDKHRSRLPVIVISIGVLLTVFFQCYITGVFGDMVDFNARYSTGHVKITTNSYFENIDQMPIDLALDNIDSLTEVLENNYPEITWIKRINFGGLLDVPDEKGETKGQGPTMGIAIDMFSENSTETERMNINEAIIRGNVPSKPGEVLISDEFATKLGVKIGDKVTLLSSTMYGSIALHNFVVAGTVNFGVAVMDKGALIADVSDVQLALDMENSCSEILGYFPDRYYDEEKATIIAQNFNSTYNNKYDEFSPVMKKLSEQNDLGAMITYIDSISGIFIFIFVLVMSIVLWNSGLISGIRRYGEVGVRLAIGEEKGHIYRSMIIEAILIGLIGSVIGTIIGLALSYWVQTVGIDISEMMKNTTMMIPTVFYARITSEALIIGFIPGLLSTVLGTMLSGIGIYKRKTAQLFKELES